MKRFVRNHDWVGGTAADRVWRWEWRSSSRRQLRNPPGNDFSRVTRKA